MTNNDLIYDVIIIGAGPAGMTASIFAHTKKLTVLALEGLDAGGQLKNLYPHKPVYNYPGYSEIKAGILADHILEQFKARNIPLKENSPVKTIKVDKNSLYDLCTPNAVYKSYGIIIACGMGVFQPNKLGVTGENDLADKNVFYSIKNIDDWKNKSVVVFGGGNSAVDNALLLKQYGCEVVLVHRMSKFQADSISVDKLIKRADDVLLEVEAKKFVFKDDYVSVHLSPLKDSQEFILDAERILINIGLRPNLEFLSEFPIEKKGKQIIVNTNMQTTLPGVYACGDIVSYPGKVRLITTAIGEAATALNSLEKYLKKHPHRNKTGAENEE